MADLIALGVIVAASFLIDAVRGWRPHRLRGRAIAHRTETLARLRKEES